MINLTSRLLFLMILCCPVTIVQAQKSTIPDIHETGQRGDIARSILAKSSRQFLRADANQDNRISSQEAAEHLPFISNKFSYYDKNKDNSLSWAEFLGHNEWPAPLHTSLTQKQ
ncbi:MAG: hypothetical protein H8E21_09385 [Gammaproteobacteria bacterium]|nr:hypothetical protein [Gammaproteobacteria bacterium]MBL6998332.1 hypothetical protein [Gammaproteobacteria bacterium]